MAELGIRDIPRNTSWRGGYDIPTTWCLRVHERAEAIVDGNVLFSEVILSTAAGAR